MKSLPIVLEIISNTLCFLVRNTLITAQFNIKNGNVVSINFKLTLSLLFGFLS